MEKSVSIVIPAHNEQDGLPKHISNVTKKLREEKISAEIVLVNDNSTDKTGDVCENLAKKYGNIKVIHRKTQPGMGGALKLGTKNAKGKIIIWLMGDISDDLDAIPKFIQKINSGYDMVMASRYMEGGNPGDLETTKRIFSKSFSTLSRIFIGVPVHDVTYAYRAFRKEVFNKATLMNNNFAISPEFTLETYLNGFKLGEVPVTYKIRKQGASKMKILKIGYSYGKILLRAFFRRISGS